MKRIICMLALWPLPALADLAVIEGAEARRGATGWNVSVTLSHPDTGWDHYADGWEVVSADGTSLGLRVLVHPHVNEQPFTRSLGGIDIPEGTSEVRIRARCNVDGWTGPSYLLRLADG